MSDDWKLAPCLQQFWDEVNDVAPHRDHASDGSIGDEAHQGTDSDHNPDSNDMVCAVDTDEDLRADFTMFDIVNYLLGECRKPNDVGLDRGRVNYLIYEGNIWRADTGWAKEKYTGSNPHDKHMHLSCEHDLDFVNDTSSWGITERFGFMDKTTFFSWLDEYFDREKMEGTPPKPETPVGHAVQSQRVPGAPFAGEQTTAWQYQQDIGNTVYETRELVRDLADDLNAHFTGIKESSD